MITDATTNAFVGLVDVNNMDWNAPKAELGSFIDTNHKDKVLQAKLLDLSLIISLKNTNL